MKVIISGGGTGGHIFPAVSIADAIMSLHPDAEILFVGAEGRMEMQRVPAAGYRIVGLPVRGLIRPLWSPKNIGVVCDFMRSRRRVKSVIREFGPDVCVGVGGYASAPTLNAAHAMGIPCLIQEQNSYAGVTNRSLAHKALRICVAYDGMERFFPADRIIKTGNPVRMSLLQPGVTKQEARQGFGLDPEKPTLLVIGGSLGARTVNESILSHLQAISTSGVQVVWQTGKNYYEHIISTIKASSCAMPDSSLVIQPFISDMAKAYRAADLVISRAGASSISEICLLGMPSILVPSPNVAEDHQTKNALALSSQGAAILIRDAEAGRQLVSVALETVKDVGKLQSLSQNAAKLAFRDSALTIAKIVDQLLNHPES